MNAVVQAQQHYLSEFNRVENSLAGASLPWLRELRRAAIAAFVARGFPNARDENWKYTRTTAIEKRPFLNAAIEKAAIDAQRFPQVLHSEFAGHLMVFVNGRYRAEWSRLDGIAQGVRVQSFGAALEEGILDLRAVFNKTDERHHPFALLNTAFADDGAYVILEKDAVLEHPLQLVFVSTGAQDGHMAHPRIVVSAGDNAEATLIERCVALDEAAYFSNVLITVTLGKNASVEYCRLQEESGKAIHISGMHVRQQKDSRFTSHVISLGGLLTRNDIDVELAAPGVECTLNGLYMAGGRQHVDTHTRIDHLHPHGTSHEFYKGVLDGHGRGVFNGKVVVHPDAQKTDARQRNQNLLLSDNAEADSKPELEIYADDVKCAHGATVGQLDADAVFYLRSRGIDEAAARSLLTYAFAGEVIERVQPSALRDYVQQALVARLVNGRQLKELV